MPITADQKHTDQQDEGAPMSIPTVDELVGDANREHIEPFIASRFPYTYAADYLRNNPHVIPGQVVDLLRASTRHALHYEDGWLLGGNGLMSRSEASSIRQEWARQLDAEDEELARRLALAYLRVNNIQRPAELAGN